MQQGNELHGLGAKGTHVYVRYQDTLTDFCLVKREQFKNGHEQRGKGWQ